MPASRFARICENLSIGDTVIISVTKERVQFSTKSDTGTANKDTAVNKKEEATDIEVEESISQKFALSYLKAFTKATPLSTQVIISLSYNLLVVEYMMENTGYIRFYLPPKLEEECA
ncbi:hypothetical protein DITRI_Ditri09bG0144800 [Diplodiscus trichospermus]